MESGDVIMEVKHQPVPTIQDVRKIHGSLKTGTDVVFPIEKSRFGQPITVYLAGTLS